MTQALFTLLEESLSATQWVEIESITFPIFEADASLLRSGWLMIGHALLGKALRIKRGEYGDGDAELDVVSWIADLKDAATIIFETLQSPESFTSEV